MTVVNGAFKPADGGVFGAISSVGRARVVDFGRSSSVLMSCGMDGGFSAVLLALRRLMLPLLSPLPKIPPSPFPPLVGCVDFRSGLVLGPPSFFREPGFSTPLILAPGETPRDLPDPTESTD